MFGLLNLWRVEKFIRNESRQYSLSGMRYKDCFHFYAIAYYLTMILKKLPDGLKMVPFIKFSRYGNYDVDKVYMIAHLNSDYFWPRINTMILAGRNGACQIRDGSVSYVNARENENALLSNTSFDIDNTGDFRFLEKLYKYLDIPIYSLYTSNFVCYSDSVLLIMDRKPFVIDKVNLSQADL